VPLSKKEWSRIRAFGANVRRQRVRKGMTQEQLAEKAEIATRNLQKIEAGEINILLTTGFRLQLALRCSWKSLMPRE
jgi:transcriptional regulator with XRE-family HTH domain